MGTHPNGLSPKQRERRRIKNERNRSRRGQSTRLSCKDYDECKNHKHRK